MNAKEVNEEIFYSNDLITKVNRADIDFLKAKAAGNQRKRVRLCSHPDVDDSLHEMLIVHAQGAYVRPHKHMKKSESFHVIEGRLKVVIFTETGDVEQVIPMGDFSSPGYFYYRLSKPLFHTVIPLSEDVVFHETTNGPFRREETIFAEWSPAEDDVAEQEKFLKNVTKHELFTKD